MHAVFQTGGKQYRVKAGDVVSVEKYPASIGDQIEIRPLLSFQNEENIVTDSEQLKSSKVVAHVLRQIRNKKVVVFKKKRRKNYRRTQGHRQSLTYLKIVEIVSGLPEEPIKETVHGA